MHINPDYKIVPSFSIIILIEPRIVRSNVLIFDCRKAFFVGFEFRNFQSVIQSRVEVLNLTPRPEVLKYLSVVPRPFAGSRFRCSKEKFMRK